MLKLVIGIDLFYKGGSHMVGKEGPVLTLLGLQGATGTGLYGRESPSVNQKHVNRLSQTPRTEKN